jgi:hypothetical protein
MPLYPPKVLRAREHTQLLLLLLFTVGLVVGFIKELGGASISLKNTYDGKILFKNYTKY